jgi:molybdenum cofactor biosynthesis enzyme MoaA
MPARGFKVFVGLGVSKLRITGGEPLVRKDAMWLIKNDWVPCPASTIW